MNDFEKVADLIGDIIDKNFKNAIQEILDHAVSGKSGLPGTLAASSTATITMTELSNFISQLGGIGLDLKFMSNVPKPLAHKLSPQVISPSVAVSSASPLGGGISISIGGTWSF